MQENKATEIMPTDQAVWINNAVTLANNIEQSFDPPSADQQIFVTPHTPAQFHQHLDSPYPIRCLAFFSLNLYDAPIWRYSFEFLGPVNTA
ncbi:MAG: hypothetical protein ACI845_003923 [Gammaproteobacteria bacterium]